MADTVAKVENRTTRRISLKSILRRACCRKALRRQYEGRWSFWYETNTAYRAERRFCPNVGKIGRAISKHVMPRSSALDRHVGRNRARIGQCRSVGQWVQGAA